MRSCEILEVLECIKAEPGLNAKIELLEDFSWDASFRRALELAYNPLKRYNLKVLPSVSPGLGDFKESTWEIFERMATGALSGDAAKIEIYEEFGRLNSESQDLFERILLKDLRADFGPRSINKAIKGFIKIEPYMRCSLPKHVKAEDWQFPMFSQLKMDGSYMTITRTDDVRIATRQGQEFPVSAFKGLREFAEERIPLGYQLQGEILFHEGTKVLKRSTSNGLVNTALQLGVMPEKYAPLFYAWDVVSIEDIQKGSKRTYIERFNHVTSELVDNVRVVSVETRLVDSMEKAVAHFEEVTARGEEGTILKVPHAVWKNGTSRQQIKLKMESSCELRVIGFVPGQGKFKGQVGSLVCISECERVVVKVSGFTDEMRKQISENFDTDYVQSVIEVKHNGVTKSKVKNEWSLLHPRFVEVRYDKELADDLADIDPSGGFTSYVKSDVQDIYEI